MDTGVTHKVERELEKGRRRVSDAMESPKELNVPLLEKQPRSSQSDFEKTVRDLYGFHIKRISSSVADYRNNVLLVVGSLGFLYFPTFRCFLIPYYVILAVLSATISVVFGLMSVADIFGVGYEVAELIDLHERGQVRSNDGNLERRRIHETIKSVTKKSLIEIFFFSIFSVLFSIMVAFHLVVSDCDTHKEML